MKQNDIELKSNVSFKRAFLFLASLLIFTWAIGQEKNITGQIIDKTGSTLPGVNVVVKGTTTGTVTDIDGKFNIKVPNESATLQFSFIGYETQEIVVGAQTSIPVTLNEAVSELNEVVVIGYGVQKKSDLTGSVASVSGSKLAEVPVANIAQALQGRAAGVSVTTNTGMPGGSVNIQIRGMTSINGTNPLVVIDGIPGGDMTKLNAADIASVEILKDAASAAIYGSSGGNGVILVTTKKGSTGKVTTNVNYSYGVQSIANEVEMMGLKDYNRVLGELKLAQFTTNIDTLTYYNWNDLFFKKDAPMQSADFSVAGGSEKSNFYISGSYLEQEGIIKKSNYTKTNLRVKADQKLTNHIKFDQNVSYSNSINEGYEEWMYTGVYQTPVYNAIIMPPYMQGYQADGKWTVTPGGVRNAMVMVDNRNYWSKNAVFDANAGLTIELFKGLTYTPRIAGTMSIIDNQNYIPKYFAKADDSRQFNELEKRMERGFNWMLQNVLTYNTSISEVHNVSAMAGMEASRNWGYDINGKRQSIASDLPNMLYFDKSLDDTSNMQNIKGRAYERKFAAYFGRLSYDYKGLVLLQFNLRRDGQSDFGPNNRWGNFYSGSAGFKFSELEAVKNLGLISFGKVRLSYGEMGQYPRSNWPYLAKILTTVPTYNYTFNNRTSLTGAGPVQIANPDIQWEKVQSQGVGVDLGFFKDKIMFSVDYFNKYNNNMLMFKDVGLVNGVFQTNSAGEGGPTRPEVNSGTVKNNGLEFSFSYKETFGDLKTQLDMNLTYVTNEITDLATDSIVKGSVHNEFSGITISKIGHSIGEFWGYQSNGIFRKGDPTIIDAKGKTQYYTLNTKGDTIKYSTAVTAGDAKWVDLNNDGIIDNSDRTYLGNPNPPLVFSFSINLTYKSLDFSAFFNGVYGNKIFNGGKRYFYDWNTRITNRAAAFADRYREPLTDKAGNLILDNHGVPIDEGNTSSSMPKMGVNSWGRSSDLLIEDGSYLRLKSIQLGYTVPQKVTQKVKIEKFRVYVSVSNVFTLTKYTGYDPEVARYDFSDPSILGVDIGGYPKTRMVTVGANLSF